MRYPVPVPTMALLAQDGGAASTAAATTTVDLTAPASVWYLVEAGGR